MVNFLKNNWRNILIIVLFLLMVGNCAKKGNYKRAFNKEKTFIEYLTDSTTCIDLEKNKKIDSLTNYIVLIENKNRDLESRNSLLKDFNDKSGKTTRSDFEWLQKEYNDLKKENRELKKEIKDLKENN